MKSVSFAHCVVLALILLVGAATFCFCYVAPVVAITAELRAADWSHAMPGMRQWGLLWSNLWISALAATIAQILGGALAVALVRPRSVARGTIAFICAFVFFTPTYIYAYAWSLPMLPQGINVAPLEATAWPAWMTHGGRAVLCLATWLAPVAAFVITEGWRRSAAPAYRAALLDASGLRAFARGAGAAITPWFWVSGVICFALSLTEFAVCHLCQVQTLNTEVLTNLQSHELPEAFIDAAMLMLTVIGAVALLLVRRREFGNLLEALHPIEIDAGGSAGSRGIGIWMWPMSVAALLAIPWVLLGASLHNPRAFRTVWTSYPIEWPHSAAWAAGAAGIATVFGVGTAWALSNGRGKIVRGVAFIATVIAALTAAAPPALVGDAVKSAYTGWNEIESSGVIISIVCAARFAAVAILLIVIGFRAMSRDPQESAQIDGASGATQLVMFDLPLTARAIVLAFMTVFVLSLNEVAASVLVRPAGVGCVAVTMLNEIHFGRRDEIIAMCAFVGIAIADCLLILDVLAFRTRRRTVAV